MPTKRDAIRKQTKPCLAEIKTFAHTAVSVSSGVILNTPVARQFTEWLMLSSRFVLRPSAALVGFQYGLEWPRISWKT